MARRPFKKDLTPIGRRGTITKHIGKGATEQRSSPGAGESLTGGDPFQRMANRYPKPAPEVPPDNAPPVPMGAPPARMPTALMPGDEDAE
jgi:hypothetical protein